MKNTFKLVGLDCANCAAQIENAVKKNKRSSKCIC